MTKSPVESAREHFSMKPGATLSIEGIEKLRALIKYAESLERIVKLQEECRLCNNSGLLEAARGMAGKNAGE